MVGKPYTVRLGLQRGNGFVIKLVRRQIKLTLLGAAEEHKVAELPVQSSWQHTFLHRDPQWAAVFWEISRPDQDRVAAAGGQQLCRAVACCASAPSGWQLPGARALPRWRA